MLSMYAKWERALAMANLYAITTEVRYQVMKSKKNGLWVVLPSARQKWHSNI